MSYGHLDDETPSFAISLYKEYRGYEIVDENEEEYIMVNIYNMRAK